MQRADPFQLRCHLYHLQLSWKLGCALKQTKKDPKKQYFRHLTVYLPRMTCSADITSPDQIQLQGLNNGKKLETVKQK